MKRLAVKIGTIALAATLTACGGGSSEPAGSDEAAEPTGNANPAPAPAAAEAPSAENTDTLDGTTFAEFTPDAAKGKRVFLQCQSCHVVEPGKNRTGPSLAGILGREAGTVDGFNYTPANANSGITWSKEKMFQYLEDPRRVIPGTKMVFAGLKDGQDRADLIAYLENPGE